MGRDRGEYPTLKNNYRYLSSTSQTVKLNFVKLQFKLNSSVQVGQGVDFVFPLSQQQEEEQEQEKEPTPKSTRTKCTTDLGFGTKT